MYEQMTYGYILNRMLDNVPLTVDNHTVDKREGSLIYTACAAVAAEMAKMYANMDINWNLSFADTATGDALTRRAAEYGINREPATKAKRKGIFYGENDVPLEIPIGSRFSLGAVNFVAMAVTTPGVYEMECEQPGTVGNQATGQMLPIDYIPGLIRAELTDILVPGEDEETDEQLRERYFEAMNEPAFGGNIADYRQKINAIDGVGATKVFPVWQGGGTVKCTIIGSDWNAPSSTLVSDVQTIVDPNVNQGKGLGTAPIGHTVTITSVANQAINVATTLTLSNGTTIGQVQAPIEAAIENYLLGLRKTWADTTGIVVREALIEAAILSVPGVVDVTNTTLNGTAANVTLTDEQIPIKGTVTLSAS
ncbi:baseplate J/gp47 family protein [Brevibacillus formosus]|uniref:baseplate J/gp47 family protein n=1 Tax=Brevibacillus formosus TaxID=54913 RepID=UPI0018CF2B7E|nr:baseplate J/gp47 family protein [Brevibacillus formosus]MBG9944699.1 phage tail protein [Brevibacillus formosus]